MTEMNRMPSSQTAPSWISIPDEEALPDHLRSDGLAGTIKEQVESRIRGGDFTDEDIRYVQKLRLDACRGELNLSDELLERLRMACKLWNIELRPREITSHRPILGPVIVAIKKLIYPILKFFLKDLIRQQKDFNAATIRLIAEMASQQKNDGGEKSRET